MELYVVKPGVHVSVLNRREQYTKGSFYANLLLETKEIISHFTLPKSFITQIVPLISFTYKCMITY